MEKIFTPNRWFVMFCALLIVVWGTLKLVQDMRLSEEARTVAMGIFSYSFPSLSVVSEVESMNAQVINRNDHESLVKVSGRQLISKHPDAQTGGSAQNDSSSERVDFQANLTFYKSGASWVLGKVELK